MRLYRSFLFMPGNRQRMLDKGPTTGAGALLIDLEDAVPTKAKEEARGMARAAVGRAGPPVFVRVNAVTSGLAREDLEAVVVPGLAGVFLPKVESADEVRTAAAWLDELEPGASFAPGSLPIVATLESASGIRLAYEIAAASPRVASLCFSGGQNGDLQTDLGCDWSLEGTETLYARSKLVLDARAAGLDYPIDGVYVDVANLDGLAVDTTLSKRLGYKARTVIHPTHVDPVNRIYTPTPSEIESYRGLLEAFDSAVAGGHGTASHEGRMIDKAMAERARRVIALAESLGAESSQGRA